MHPTHNATSLTYSHILVTIDFTYQSFNTINNKPDNYEPQAESHKTRQNVKQDQTIFFYKPHRLYFFIVRRNGNLVITHNYNRVFTKTIVKQSTSLDIFIKEMRSRFFYQTHPAEFLKGLLQK